LLTAEEPVVLVASSEFTLKSSPVRRTLEQRLIDDLKFTLRRGNVACSRVEKEAARLVVFGPTDVESAAVLCSRIFGVAYAAPATLLVKPSVNDIIEAIAKLALNRLSPGKSFAVRAHCAILGSITRRDVELQGGSRILREMRKQGVSVDLDAPDVTFYVDLVGRDAYVYCEKLKGPGGLPLSAHWKMLAVLDNGPLSILAACAMMRRGCVVQLFIPTSGTIGYLASETQLALAERVARLVTRSNYKGFIVEMDGQHGSMVDYARSFIREAAIKFAREKRFRGVIFGDISGDLSSLRASDPVFAQVPVFYPLLGLQEEDLADLSRLVGIGEGELFTQFNLERRSRASQGEVKLQIEDFQIPAVREIQL
jgi:thiamine biosynthesis protein ThiI